MNRFEALNILGLTDESTEEDVRLAFYGIKKAAEMFDFSEFEQAEHRVDNMLNRATAANKFLLSAHNMSSARRAQVQADRKAKSSKKQKLTITATEAKESELKGLERVRGALIQYLDQEQSIRRSCIIALIICVVVGFIGIRYFRGGIRVWAFIIIGVIAVGASSLVTATHLHIKKIRGYIQLVDDEILAHKIALGLEPDPNAEPEDGEAAEGEGTDEAEGDDPAAVDEGDESEEPEEIDCDEVEADSDDDLDSDSASNGDDPEPVQPHAKRKS